MYSALQMAAPQRIFRCRGSRNSGSSLHPGNGDLHFRMRMVAPSVAISRVLPLWMPVSFRISAGMMMRPWVSMFRINAILISIVLSIPGDRTEKEAGVPLLFLTVFFRICLCGVWILLKLLLYLLALGLLVYKQFFSTRDQWLCDAVFPL